MDYKRFVTIMGVIKTAYSFFVGTENEKNIQVWYSMLNDIDIESLEKAVMRWVKTETKAPTIADLRNTVYGLTNSNNWEQGWAMLQSAINKWGNSRETVDYIRGKSEITYKAMKTLSLWSICNSENEIVTRSQFRDIFNSIAKENKTQKLESNNCGNLKAISSDVKEIGGASIYNN